MNFFFLRGERWWINCRRAEYSYRNPDHYKLIVQMAFCEDHFSEDQFMCPADKGSGKPRIRLRPDAVPNLFDVPNAPKVAHKRRELVRNPLPDCKKRQIKKGKEESSLGKENI